MAKIASVLVVIASANQLPQVKIGIAGHADLCVKMNGGSVEGTSLVLGNGATDCNTFQQKVAPDTPWSYLFFPPDTNHLRITGGESSDKLYAGRELWMQSGNSPGTKWAYMHNTGNVTDGHLFLTRGPGGMDFHGKIRGGNPLCMDIKDGNAAPGTPLVVQECADVWSQYWYVAECDNSAWDPACDGGGGPTPPPPPSPPSPVPPPSTWYKTLRPYWNSDFCIDLPGSEATNGNRLWLWECNGAESQRWVFDSYQIRYGADENMCLDAGGMTSGTQLMLWECNGWPQQAWSYDEEVHRIFIPGDPLGWGTCLDWYSGDLKGQPLHTWDCNDQFSQEWALWGVDGAVELV